jgi:hypothetical protein
MKKTETEQVEQVVDLILTQVRRYVLRALDSGKELDIALAADRIESSLNYCRDFINEIPGMFDHFSLMDAARDSVLVEAARTLGYPIRFPELPRPKDDMQNVERHADTR